MVQPSKASTSSDAPSEWIHIPKPTEHVTKLLGRHKRYTHYTSTAPNVAVAYQYTAIRYAQPQSLGDRFRRARPLNGISMPLNFRPTPVCPQRDKNLLPHQRKLVSEDCLTLEIYIPADVEDQEIERRPVFMWIHGGFLQFGHPVQMQAAEFARRTGAVVVLPAYRLNLFGFLACEEMRDENEGTVGNLGFWDQRLAIEWTARNIHAFGGDRDRITVSGYSAGSYSTFHQLMYESYLPDEQAHIKNVIMQSNGCGLQPKSIEETRWAFLALAEACGVPTKLPGHEQLERLRQLSTEELVTGLTKVPVNAFRACTDGVWARKSYMQDISSGKLGRTLARRGVRLIIGEVKEEHNLYRGYEPPKSYFGLVQRLTIEYPAINSNRLAAIYAPGGKLPPEHKSWPMLFGHIYADCQVHLSERGLLAALKRDVPAEQIFRYRIYRRLKCVDEFLPVSWGVTHSSDMPIWFAGNGYIVEDGGETAVVNAWVNPLRQFLAGGEGFDWGTSGYDMFRTIKEEAWEIGVERDPLWEYYLNIWRRLYAARKKL